MGNEAENGPNTQSLDQNSFWMMNQNDFAWPISKQKPNDQQGKIEAKKTSTKWLPKILFHFYLGRWMNGLHSRIFSLASMHKYGILLPKLFWPTVRKKCSKDRENFCNSWLKAQNFEITRTIYSNSERSEKSLVTEWFLTCSWQFLRSSKLGQLEFKLGRNNWDLETYRKS